VYIVQLSRTFNALNALVWSKQIRFKQTPNAVCTDRWASVVYTNVMSFVGTINEDHNGFTEVRDSGMTITLS